MAPLADPSAEAQQHIGQERRPHLPAHRVGVVSEEVSQLESLFDLLEKDFDFPSAPIQINDRLRAPFQVVRQELHLSPLAVHLHHRHDPPQPRWIEPTRSRGFHLHHVVAQNIAAASPLISPDHPELHPLFGARHPRYPAFEQFEEVEQVQIRFVENHNLPVQQARAHLPSFLGVAVARRVHEGKPGQKTLQVESQMTFRRRLAPPVLGPVHTVAHQLEGGRIHQMDHPFEAEAEPAAPPTAKTRTEILQVLQGLPKQFLRHDGVPLAIGMGKRVALRWRGSTNRREGARVQRQRVANVVESQTMGQLCEEQREHVTPGRVGARVIRHACLPSQLRNQMIGNEVADLTQQSEPTLRWLLFSAFCFHNRALWHGARQKPTLLSSETPSAYGMAVSKKRVWFGRLAGLARQISYKKSASLIRETLLLRVILRLRSPRSKCVDLLPRS